MQVLLLLVRRDISIEKETIITSSNSIINLLTQSIISRFSVCLQTSEIILLLKISMETIIQEIQNIEWEFSRLLKMFRKISLSLLIGIFITLLMHKEPLQMKLWQKPSSAKIRFLIFLK